MFSLDISNRTKKRLDKKWFESILYKIEKELFVKNKKSQKFFSSFKISLCFVNNKEMKGINKTYRGVNKTTDVLSFGLISDKKFILPKKNNFLGEIIISYPEAKRQAKQYNFSLKKEFFLLFLHGILHLLGFDHKTKKERVKMLKIEENILKKINAF